MLGVGILDRVVEIFIKEGVKLLKENHEFSRLQEAISEKIARELRFNAELLDAILRNKNSKNQEFISALTESLKTTAFDSLSDSSLPLTLFFGESEIQSEDWLTIHEKFPYPSKNYVKWASTINNPSALIERIYHRTKIIKLFSLINISKNQQSIKYVLFLIKAHRQGIGSLIKR